MKKHLRFYCILLTCMLCSISAKAEFDTRVRYGIGNLYYYLDFSSMEAIIAPDNSYSGSLVIPEKLYSRYGTFTITGIYASAFENCDDLTSVTIPNSITSIGNFAFSSCSGLTSITIPNSVKSIGDNAFSSCTGLTSVTIPNSVTTIGDYAFWVCESLKSITIPNSVTSIGDCSFASCRSLTDVKIGNSVKSIGFCAFMLCSSLTSVTIPNSVDSIADLAFADCSSIKSITIPNSVTSLGWGAFDNCESLTSVNIGNSITTIMGGAFGGCKNLTSVKIGNSVTTIKGGAFSGCSKIQDVYCYTAEPPQAIDSYFTFAFNATLHVPAESIDKYSSITPWDNFGSIVPLTGQELAIKNIGAYDNIAMSASANAITISGLRDGEVCSLYSLSGSKLDQATAANGSVSLCAKGQSVVVVSIGSQNMKMIIK